MPALAPSNDPTGQSTPDRLLRPDDIALVLAHDRADAALHDFLDEAHRRGVLTIALCAEGGAAQADYCFVVPSADLRVVQEVHETAYHVLWELVHVFFEHPGLLDDACITCGDVAVEARVVAVRNGNAIIERNQLREEVAVELVDGVEVGDLVLCHAGVVLEKLAGGSGAAEQDAGNADFLYPFLAAEERDLDSVLADVSESTRRKAADVIELRRAIDPAAIERCAGDLRERFGRAGRLIAFGNGGSSTDAQDVAADCLALGWLGVALTNDVATVTAVGNDVGFDNVFARQLIPLARAQDVALAISTSGNSPNLVAALEEARSRGMLTCAIVGYDGGRIAELGWLDHLFVVPSDYIPRIQEAQATIYHLLLDAVGGR